MTETLFNYIEAFLIQPYQLFKWMAFKLDAERAHNLGLSILSRKPELAKVIFRQKELGPQYQTHLKCGLTWKFPIGLAAGLDKNAEAIDFFSQLYFGAVEIGTVTPLAQAGNPKPRMFRLLKEKSLLNRMGFNNDGADKVLDNLKRNKKNDKILGVNIGKNKLTKQENAPEDYKKLYQKLSKYSDYMVVNVSSPNTPGLRDLQSEAGLNSIFSELKSARRESPKPLFLKIAPDLPLEALDAVIKIAHDFELAGLIATNTTIMEDIGKGGVSGKLLKERSEKMRNQILERLGKNSSLDLIGVGGVDSYKELVDFWKRGGRCMQIYSSFIYKGPDLLSHFKDSIDASLTKYQVQNIEQLQRCLIDEGK